MDEQQYTFMAIKERKIYQETDVALIKRKVGGYPLIIYSLIITTF